MYWKPFTPVQDVDCDAVVGIAWHQGAPPLAQQSLAVCYADGRSASEPSRKIPGQGLMGSQAVPGILMNAAPSPDHQALVQVCSASAVVIP